jgi:hypothetical protein
MRRVEFRAREIDCPTAEIDKILTLHTTAHSNSEIADLLAINRETVGKYIARYKTQNQPNAPSGSKVAVTLA